jgi:hypothetical protein
MANRSQSFPTTGEEAGRRGIIIEVETGSKQK